MDKLWWYGLPKQHVALDKSKVDEKGDFNSILANYFFLKKNKKPNWNAKCDWSA